MPRVSLLDLPTEVHFEILKNTLYSSQKPYYGPGNWPTPHDDEIIPISWDWVEKDRRKISQFPYNAAAVCQLWHDILIKVPACWTRVIIDVATDPTRFLDIFLWSKDLPKLEVTILNSASHNPDSQDVDYSTLERRRVSAIVNALLPHTSRCISITFDVAFVTSLPSPIVFLLEDAPHLNELVLKCKINNTGAPDDYSHACEPGVREPMQTLASFPQLTSLSLTGFWFMFISGHPHSSEWFKRLYSKTRNLHFSISRFQFQTEGQYTLQNFVKYCSALKPDPLVLADLSLNHDGPILECDEYDDDVFIHESVVFRNVSPDVLSSLFFLAKISPMYLTFDNCTFPDRILPSGASELFLQNMHCPSSANPTTNLHSILQEFIGYSLFIESCSAFDDNAISPLPGYPHSALRLLELTDSKNFTVHGLIQYLERRNKHHVSHSGAGGEPLERLVVEGIIDDCPFPSQEDEEWFENSEYAQPIHVHWLVRHPETQVALRRYNKEVYHNRHH